MINRADSNKLISTQFSNLNTYDTDILPYNKGFRFGVTLTNALSQPIPLDPSLFTLKISQEFKNNNGATIFIDEDDLGYELCDIEKEFPQIGDDLLTSTID